MRSEQKFFDEIREIHFPGQTDIFTELEILPPFRPNCRCKGCAIPWHGEDARDSLPKAKRRGCWFVSNKRVLCPNCVREAK